MQPEISLNRLNPAGRKLTAAPHHLYSTPTPTSHPTFSTRSGTTSNCGRARRIRLTFNIYTRLLQCTSNTPDSVVIIGFALLCVCHRPPSFPNTALLRLFSQNGGYEETRTRSAHRARYRLGFALFCPGMRLLEDDGGILGEWSCCFRGATGINMGI